jgi:hypothetical protein
LTLYGLSSYWSSLLARLSSLESRGVIFALDDEGELTVRVPAGRLTEPGARERLKQSKQELTEAVRLREGLCVSCGMDTARHPKRLGEVDNWIPETQQVIKGNCSALGVYPTYCLSCWETRLCWQDVTVRISKNARSEKAKTETAIHRTDARVRRERTAAPELFGDSGGGSVEGNGYWTD